MMNAEIKAKIESFFNVSVYSTHVEYKRDAVITDSRTKQKVKVAIAKFGFGDEQAGISYQTYEANKEYIEGKFAEAQRVLEEARMRENWVVCALAHLVPSKAFKEKSIPLAVYKKMNAHYVTREEREEMDEFDLPAGWEYDEKIFEEEARKVATPEQVALAEKIRAEIKASTEERQKKHEEKVARRAEALEEAKKLAQEFDVVADWSWDDYAFRVGKVVKETKYWNVCEYLYDANYHSDKREAEIKLEGYVLEQKDKDYGTISFMEYSKRDPFELTETRSPPAVQAFKEMAGA